MMRSTPAKSSGGARWPSVVLVCGSVLALAANGVEGDPLAAPRDSLRCCNCPNDYCPKPLPCVPCASLGTCDCYSPRPLPCPPCPLRYCSPDDYCPKPYSLCLPLCSPSWYTCGAANCAAPVKR